MKLSEFDFDLPPDRIAHSPCAKRDQARLLSVPVSGEFANLSIRDLPTLLQPGDLLVFNNTKVLPARLVGKKGDATIEITLHKPVAEGWRAFAKRSKRLKHNDTLIFGDAFSAKVIEKYEGGEVLIEFDEPDSLSENLHKYGTMPLPPYIKREGTKETQEEDKSRYQTIYAEKEGAVAAPTAGLHFTPELLSALDAKGIGHCFVTLHVGGGTFLPVKTENVAEHKMHSEWYEITKDTADKINDVKKAGGRIVAVGTTSLRSLESAASTNNTVNARQEETDIFITPGYNFKVVDLLFTNFHLPKSTLLMLVSAFSGRQRIKAAYQHAIQNDYRFFSYGDACLLEKAKAGS